MPEMLNKRGDRNTRSGEDRGLALNVWIAVENPFAFHSTSCSEKRRHEAEMETGHALPVG